MSQVLQRFDSHSHHITTGTHSNLSVVQFSHRQLDLKVLAFSRIRIILSKGMANRIASYPHRTHIIWTH